MDGNHGRLSNILVRVLATVVLLTTGNLSSSYADITTTAIISTIASDYTSGAHSVVSVEPIGGPRTVQNNLLPTISDITVAAYGKYFYRIERYMSDNVTKFDIAAPDTPVWQFSTLDDDESGSSNPQDLIFVSDEKAYLLRYGKTKAWIVNPSAATQAEFKVGELDMGAYADSDGNPEMRSGVIVDGKLFVTMQRLDRNDSWNPTNDAFVAVFDSATDTQIDTGTPNDEGLPGIEIPIKNPGAIQFLEDSDKLYIQGSGDFGSTYSGTDPEYSGGIISLDPDTYAIDMVVDDGDANTHPYGNISGMSLVSAAKGYFVGYDGWADNTLYVFNPTTSIVDGPANSYLQNKNIAGMEAGTFADQNDMLSEVFRMTTSASD